MQKSKNIATSQDVVNNLLVSCSKYGVTVEYNELSCRPNKYKRVYRPVYG